MTTIGQRIAQARKLKKMTQQKLAEKSFTDYNTLRKVETGKTKNPSSEFIEKIAKALNLSSESLIEDQKPNTRGADVLDFLQLSPERFESLVEGLLINEDGYADVQRYGGRGDKQRDIITRKIINGVKAQNYTLAQAKRHKKTSANTLTTELDSIKDHFFSRNKKIVTPIDSIEFYLADSPSAKIKDDVKAYAKSLKIPEPIFYEARSLDLLCRKHDVIMNEFFGGHLVEIRKGQKQVITCVEKSTQEIKDALKHIETNFETTLSSSVVMDDVEMTRARRLLDDGKYSEAKDILLEIKVLYKNKRDKEKLKKIYNNLGVCISQEWKKEDVIKEEDIAKALGYFEEALCIDENFNAPKQNIAETILTNGLKSKYNKALKYSKELTESDPKNLDYTSLYIFALNSCHDKLSVAKTFIENKFGSARTELRDNERLSIVVTQTYLNLGDLVSASQCIDIGLSSFPESINLNRFKGYVLMEEVNKGGSESRPFDTVPFFLRANLAEEAAKYFKKSLSYAKTEKLSARVLNDLKLELYGAVFIANRDNNERFGETIEVNELSDDQKKNMLLLNIAVKLEQEKDYEGAYQLCQQFIDNYNPEYKEIKSFAQKFWRHGSPKNTIKILLQLASEAKANNDFEYWALLSVSYALEGKKNDALRVINEAKAIFIKDKEIYKDVLSHYSALVGRYRDNSESDRLVQNIFELHDMMPEKNIIQPVKATEEDGSISKEMKDFLITAKEDFEKKRELFLNNPMPVYFLKKMFGRSFVEAIEIPRNNYDFNFVIPYNTPSEGFITELLKDFDAFDTVVIDYCALLNFARCGQLGLLRALGKKIKASEYLLFEVQDELATCEKQVLREAWDFLCSGDVEIFSHQNKAKQKKPSEPIKKAFEDNEWLVQSITYCMNNNVLFLTDDLRLLNLMKSSDIGIKSINSFAFFQTGLKQGIVDKKQYSLILGGLAELFFYFIPFNGDDLLNIVLDDDNKIRSHAVPFGKGFKQNPDLTISLRTYHLLNQVKLPGSIKESFLIVCSEFLTKFVRLGVMEEDKVNWTLFLTNFFYESEEANTLDYIKFVTNIWVLLFQFTPKEHKDLISEKIKMIESNVLKVGIENAFNEINNK